MKLSLFQQIADEMADYPHATLRIHGVGDPISWKHLRYAVAYTARNRVRTWLFTCLLTTDRAALEAIGQYVDILEVSINSTDEADYSLTKGVDKFDLIQKNLNDIIDTVKKNNGGTKILVSRVQSSDTVKDSRFIAYWKSRHGIHDAFIRSFHDYNSGLNNSGPAGCNRSLVPQELCLVHWRRFNIDTKGQAVYCFNELFHGRVPPRASIIGDVRVKKIKEIWQGQELNEIRHAHINGSYSGSELLKGLFCRKCSHSQPLNSESQQTSESQVDYFSCT